MKGQDGSLKKQHTPGWKQSDPGTPRSRQKEGCGSHPVKGWGLGWRSVWELQLGLALLSTCSAHRERGCGAGAAKPQGAEGQKRGLPSRAFLQLIKDVGTDPDKTLHLTILGSEFCY